MNREKTARARRVIFEQLERRVLLSADPVLDALEGRTLDIEAVVDGSHEASLGTGVPGISNVPEDSQAAESDDVQPTTDVYFIDSRVPDALTLIEDLRDNAEEGVEIVLLDARSSGIDQIGEALAGFRNLDAVHVISHGAPGAVHVGNTTLDLAALEEDGDAIRGWGESFAEGGDILFYGCDLAAGTDGQVLVDQLAALTGADVAASIDLTGSTDRGGDWELEYHSGAIETPVGFDSSTRQAFSGILAPNAPPTVGATPTDQAFTQGGQAAEPFDGVSIDPVEGVQTIDEIVLSITNVTDNTHEILNVDGTAVALTNANSGFTSANGYGFLVNLAGSTATVTLTTTGAAAAAAESLVDTLSYENTGSPPTAADRVVTLLSVKDSGGIGGGGNDTATPNIASTVHVSASGSALWLSTDSNVVAPGADGLPSGWTEGQVLALGGPDLALGDPTDGDLSSVIDFDNFTLDPVDAGALHFVSRDITVGGGANTFDLKSGDVLVSFLQPETILAAYTSSGSDENYSDRDLLVFRPASFDDYSTGTFYLLLDEVVVDDLKGVTLVEQDTSIGSTPISAGSFLIIEETSATTSVDLFEPTGVGAGTTTGTTTPLIDLSNLGIDADTLRGIELIESATSLGGQALSAGSLLATLRVNDNISGVGSNNLLVDMQDVFALNLTATGIGTTAGTAAMVLDGGDVKLDGTGGAESPYALALKNYSQLIVDTTSDVSDGDTSSLVALLQNQGADGTISLREAIEAANATPNGDIGDTITFDIPLDDLNHFYYQDDGVGGQVTLTNIVATTLPDGSIVDIDPDFAKSWFSIQVGGGLPSISEALVIDGTTQTEFVDTPIIELDGNSTGAGVNGLTITAGGSTIRGLVINQFGGDGVHITTGDGNLIEGNYIGTDVSGTRDLGNAVAGVFVTGGASSNNIGGLTAAQRNIISGNNDDGLKIEATAGSGNTVIGNYIGLDASGTSLLGNAGSGIDVQADGNTIGGSAAGARNVSSGNTFNGVVVSGSENSVQGNYVGTDVNGNAVFGNGRNGIWINGGSDNLIGGTAADTGNVVAGNTWDGIRISGGTATGNAILGNSVHGNSGLGVDLGADGVTGNDTAPDDGDSGANNLQNYPVIDSAQLSGTDLTLSGSLDTDGVSKQYRIEFFGNAAGTQDASNGEGRYYLGATTVTTDGSGDATFTNVTLSGVTLDVGDYVTATATFIADPANVGIDDSLAYASTSEFAVNVAIVDVNTPPTITSDGGGSTASINVAENTPSVTTVTASDSDGDTPTFTKTGGADQGFFSVTSGGVLTLNSARDFEDFTDSDNDGVYEVEVTADDGKGGTDLQAISVTITDANDAPVFIEGGVGYWQFDEGSGATTGDSAQGSSTGTLGSSVGVDANDPTWTTGRFGQALQFDGVDDYVEIADAPELDISGPAFSASLWINPSRDPNTEDMFFMKGDRTGDVNYYLSWKDTGHITWAFKRDGENFDWLNFAIPPAEFPAVGEWTHIAIVFERPTVSLYVNGTEYLFDESVDGPPNGGSMDRDLTANSNALLIGAGRSGGSIVSSGFSAPFAGLIDDFAIYDRALSGAEVQTIHTSQPAAAAADSFVIAENSAFGTVLGTVAASDQDVGDTLSYSITAGNTGGAFAIDANGQITVNDSPVLDFETTPSFALTVEADDGNGGIDTQLVHINLTNVQPVISATGNASVDEDAVYTLNLSADEHVDTWTINWGDGSIDTVAGTETSATHTYSNGGFTNNITVSATDVDGTVHASDLVVPGLLGTDRLYRLEGGSGNLATDFFQDIGLNWSLNATVGPDGLLYVGEYNGTSDRIHKFDPATGNHLGVFVTSGSAGLNGPAGMEFGPDGNLYVASNFSDEILRFDGTTGAPIGTGVFVTANSGGLNEPDDITFGPDGDLYVTSFNTDQVLRYDGMTGEFKKIFVAADPGNLDKPSELVFGPDGKLYVTSVGTNQVVRYYSDGSFDKVFTSGVTMNEPRGAVFGPDGDLYVADVTAIRRFDGTTGIYSGDTLASSPDIDWPTQFTFLPSHQVLVNPINDAPLVLAPGSDLSATEQTNLSIEGAGFSVDDVDAGMGTATVTLNVGEGVLTVVVGDSGVAIDSGDGTGTLVLSGRVSDIDKLLTGSSTGTITYFNGSDAPSASTTLTVTVDDGGDTGADPGNTGTPTSEAGSNSVTINITATNDAATIGGVDTANLTEDTGTVNGYLNASGTLTATDVDDPDNTFTAASHRGTLGDLVIDGPGNWTYTVDNSLPAVQALAAGSSVNDVVTVSSIDGTTHDITITITGNAAPTAVNDSYTVDENGTLEIDWWDSDWSRRSEITFDNSGQAQTLTDFPVLVTLNSGNIDYAFTNDDGSDLRFFDANGNALAYDIEEWNESGDSYVWVKVPQITGGSNTDAITMYWGNASAASAEDASAVWSNGYSAVHHLHDDFNDATVQQITGTNSGSADTIGNVGDGQLFDGADDFVSLGDDASIQNTFNGGGTVSAWIYATGWGEGGYGRIFDKSGNTLPSNTGWALELFGGGQRALLFQVGFSGTMGQWYTGVDSISLNAWNHVSVSYDASNPSNVPQIYINGNLQALNSTQPTGTLGSDAGYDFTVGNHAAATTRTFDGTIDNVQISSTARSADWIKAQYLATSGLFASVSTADSVGATAGVLDNDTATEPHTPRATNLNTTGTLGLVTLNNDGTFSYDTNGQFDYLGAGVDATDTFSYTLDDGVNPPTVATVTMTVTGVDDSPVAHPDGVHLSFDGDDFVRVSDSPSLQMTTTVTMEAWINHNGGGTGSQLIFNKEGEYEMGITADTGEIKFAIAESGGTWNWHDTGYFITAGEWTHVAVAYDGVAGEAKTYVNGELVNTRSQFGVIGDVYPGFKDLFIGGRENVSTQRFQGQIDEVRVWSTARSQGEIQTTMYGPLTGAEPGLAGNWRLDEAAGGAVIDQSPFGNDGVLGGAEGAPAVPVYQGYLTNENTLLSIPAGSGVLVNDLDVDSGSLTVTNLDTTGMLGSLVMNSADGSFTYDPRGVFEQLAFGEQITETFTYTANDGTSDSNAATVSITVTGVNDAPTVSVTATNPTFTEGGAAADLFNAVSVGTGESGQNIDQITLAVDNVTDGANEVLNVDGTAVALSNGNSGTTTNNGYGYTVALAGNTATVVLSTTGAAPTAAQTIIDTLSYQNNSSPPTASNRVVTLVSVRDSGGNADGGSDSVVPSVASTVTVDLVPTAVNDTNTATDGGADIGGNVISNDTQGDAPTSVIAANQGGNAITVGSAFTTSAGGSLTLNSNGSYIYTPPVAVPPGGLTEVFSYTIADADGDAGGAVLTITVTQSDPTPSAINDTNTATEAGVDVNGNVISNDILGDAPTTVTAASQDGNAITVGSAFATSAGGSLTLNSNGSYTYAPPAQGAVPPSGLVEVFTYTITDANGDIASAKLIITVVDNDQTPSAVNDTATAIEDTVLTSGNVLANDNLGDEPATVTAFDTTSAFGGAVVSNGDGTFTYTPAVNFHGSDSFTYTITDLDGDSSTATVTITVTAVNDVPVAANDSVITSEDNAVTTGNVLSNDNPGDEPTSIAGFDAVSANGGSVVNNGDGSFTYTPATNFNGSDSFTYTITDLDGETSTATVMITVAAVNDVPAAAGDSYTTAEETTVVTGNVLMNDGLGEEPTTITAFDATSVAGGTVVDNLDGTFTYTPAANFYGIDSFTYTISDNDGETSMATVTITVTAVNDVPVASADNYSTVEDTATTTGNVLANDSLGDGPTAITEFDAISANGGTVVTNGNDTFRYLPAAGFTGTDSFTYTITDQDGESTTATVTLTVAPASASEEEPLPNALTPSAGVSPPPDAGVPVPGNDNSDAPQPSDDDNDALFPLSEATSTARGSTGSEPPTEEESSVEESSGEETPTENVEPANETADEVDGNTPTGDALAGDSQSQSQVQTPDSRPRVPEPRANGISGLNTFDKPPLMASPEFLTALDEIRAALDQNAPLAEEQLQVLAAGVTVTGISLTAGSVTWAIRGGSLLTTLLAGIPAWKGFDPLPVVLTARPHRKAREQDKEKGEPDDMETKAARLFEADDEMPPAEEPAVKTS